MNKRTIDEMIAYFNQEVSKMDIPQKDKMTLLGMITAIGYEYQNNAVQVVRCGKCNRRYKPLDDDARNEIYCEFIGSTMRKDDFCSYGCSDGEGRDEQ